MATEGEKPVVNFPFELALRSACRPQDFLTGKNRANERAPVLVPVRVPAPVLLRSLFHTRCFLTTVPQGWYRNIMNNQLEKQERGLDTKFMMPAMFLHGGRR